VATNKQIKQSAMSLLAHVGNDIIEIDQEMETLRSDVSDLAEKERDALWAGDKSKAHGIKYKVMLKAAAYRELKTRRRKIMMERSNA
jgi:hypothetical protein